MKIVFVQSNSGVFGFCTTNSKKIKNLKENTLPLLFSLPLSFCFNAPRDPWGAGRSAGVELVAEVREAGQELVAVTEGCKRTGLPVKTLAIHSKVPKTLGDSHHLQKNTAQ